MKRKPVATEFKYDNCRYNHHSGPVVKLESRDKCSFSVPQSINIRRYNAIQIRRKLRLASYVPAPRLVKQMHFTNNPH